MRRHPSIALLAVTVVAAILLGSRLPPASAAPPDTHPSLGVPQAVFQWKIELDLGNDKKTDVFLWIPPETRHVRGVLIGGQVLFEDAFVADPHLRRACADEHLAIVQFVPGIDAIFNYKAPDFQSDKHLQAALDALAKKSGHPELAAAPFFPFGHSVSTMFACHVATRFPTRTFGFLSFKGGVDANTDPDLYAGIPFLAIKGEFEEFGPAGPLRRDQNEDRTTSWTVMRQTLLALRARDDRNLALGLLESGATHFRYADDRYGTLVADFVRKSARLRIPVPAPNADPAAPVVCSPIDPASGWLYPSDPFERAAAPAAPYAEYKGDKSAAFWVFDREFAASLDAYYAANPLGRKPQFVTFADPATGAPLSPGTDLRLNFRLAWTGPDTFKVATTFIDTPPAFYPDVPRPVGHAPGPIRVHAYSGAVEPVDDKPGEFRAAVNGRKTRITRDAKTGKTVISIRCDLIAVHPGDADYRPAEQMGRSKSINSPQGKPQTLTFDAVPPILDAAAPPLQLKATSDSGLPVRFYVESGPAVIRGDTLVLTDVPAIGDTFEITVVAWQFGSQIEPKFSAADPVVRTITVRRKP